MADNKYSVDYAKRVAGCKKCKAKIEKGECRIAKITASPFSDDGEMKHFHHPKCIFETFKRARASTKIIEEPGDIEGFQDLKDEDKAVIKRLIKENSKDKGGTSKSTPAKAPKKTTASTSKAKPSTSKGSSDAGTPSKSVPTSTITDSNEEGVIEKRSKQGDLEHKDNSFREFRRLCTNIAEESSYNAKTEIVRKFFSKGTDGKSFKGDLYVWVRLLLPGVVKRVYNLQSKQLVKIFSRVFSCSEDDMLEDLEEGDVAETISKFFDSSDKIKVASKSRLTVHDIDEFLDNLTKVTKEDDQQSELTKIAKKCTSNDLKMFVRLIKGDLRIQAGAKHILDGVHKDAYDAFNNSRNVTTVLDKVLELREKGKPQGTLDVGASLMHPVQPMLAQACTSVDMAFKKCPNGMFAEIKYDGERVQLHKKSRDFKYFSRSLKPVMPHKVKHFADYIPKAFPDGSDLILDGEVLMIDNKTGNPLPFGTLGVHKGSGFKDASVCFFVFDCIYYNGQNLMKKSTRDRRKFLHDHMKEIENHVKFSETELITKKEQLGNMIRRVLKEGLEGLVLKDLKSPYEPGKRHWLKVKKDYLNEGSMADSADLIVVGAYFGTGNRGGIMSIFLMGCYDERSKQYRTVTKVHTGVDDATLDRLQKELGPLMTKIKRDYDALPGWLNCNRQLVPDFVATNPKKMPVWEITGAEFSKADQHTADGISIRFPRITRMRDDKTWETATSLEELKHLFKVSKEETDFEIDYSTTDAVSTADTSTTNNDEDDLDITIEEETEMEVDLNKSIDSNSKFVGKSYNKTRIVSKFGLQLDVIQGDLFDAPQKVSLAHCISRDYKLGKGIAKLFLEKFGRIDELKKSGADVGGVAVLKEKGRFIYNLVTKEVYKDLPTYESLEKSLNAMRDHAMKNGVTEIAMPQIGCGLDGLNWNAVRTLIKNVFYKDKIQITIKVLKLDDATSVTNQTPPKKKMKMSPTKGNSQRSVKDMFSAGASTPKKRGHSEDRTTEVKTKKTKLEALPNIFDTFKIIIEDKVSDVDKLKRYTIAFGGEILQEYDTENATHIIYKSGTCSTLEASKNTLHLTEDFLIDSIKLEALQNPMHYSV